MKFRKQIAVVLCGSLALTPLAHADGLEGSGSTAEASSDHTAGESAQVILETTTQGTNEEASRASTRLLRVLPKNPQAIAVIVASIGLTLTTAAVLYHWKKNQTRAAYILGLDEIKMAEAAGVNPLANPPENLRKLAALERNVWLKQHPAGPVPDDKQVVEMIRVKAEYFLLNAQ